MSINNERFIMIRLIQAFYFLASLAALVSAVEATELVLERHWELTGVEKLEPSGLSFCDDQLVMVSDRHNDTVYSIPLNDAVESQVIPYRPINLLTKLPQNITWKDHLIDLLLRWTDKRFDWEGIHCDDNGALYLASESLSAIAKIGPNSPNGRESAQWITPSFAEEVKQHGFFNSINSGFEGITVDGHTSFIALEREPRGLVSIHNKNKPAYIKKIQEIDEEGISSKLKADFTGLWLEPSSSLEPSSRLQFPKIYTLERNYFRVCRRSYSDWKIEQCWSYATTEKSSNYRFNNDQYGMAEGIARSGKYLYIVLDNNQETRRRNNSKNPLLFQFKLPENW